MPALTLDKLCVKETGDKLFGLGIFLSSEEDSTSVETNLEKEKTYDFTSISGIEYYLDTKYPSVKTDTGIWKFEYNVLKNSFRDSAYDYNIHFEYNYNQMFDLKYSIEYTDEQCESTKKQLKNFMQTVANDLMKKMPDKKLEGSFYYSYYKYPNIKEGFTSYHYCSWSNHEWRGNYAETPVSSFRWLPEFDDEVW